MTVITFLIGFGIAFFGILWIRYLVVRVLSLRKFNREQQSRHGVEQP